MTSAMQVVILVRLRHDKIDMVARIECVILLHLDGEEYKPSHEGWWLYRWIFIVQLGAICGSLCFYLIVLRGSLFSVNYR